MGFKEEMDLAWQEQVESQAVQEFRATVENLKYVAEETKAKLDEIVAAGTFSTVDQSIVTEGGAVRTLVNQMVTALEEHSDFIDWKQPR